MAKPLNHTPRPPCEPGTTWARRTCSSRSSTATRASRTAGATSGRRRGSRARSTCHPHAQRAVLALPVLALPVLALPVTAPRLARAWPHPAARGLAPLGLGRCAHSAAEGLACPDTSRSLRPPRPKRAHADSTGGAALRGPPATPHTGRRQLLEALLAVGPALLHLVCCRERGQAALDGRSPALSARACRNCRPPGRSVTREGQRS